MIFQYVLGSYSLNISLDELDERGIILVINFLKDPLNEKTVIYSIIHD